MSDIGLVYTILGICMVGFCWVILCICSWADRCSNECKRLSREITRINQYNGVQYEKRYEMDQRIKELEGLKNENV